MGVVVGLSREAFLAWVAASCEEQGVPLHVADPVVVERVRLLLTGRAAASTGRRDSQGTASEARQRRSEVGPWSDQSRQMIWKRAGSSERVPSVPGLIET